MSERRACNAIGVDRSSVRYRSVRPDDAALRTRMRELAAERRRFGYRRLHVLLRHEGLVANRKRTQRLYREEGLTVRKRRGRKRAVGTRAPILTVAAPNALGEGPARAPAEAKFHGQWQRRRLLHATQRRSNINDRNGRGARATRHQGVPRRRPAPCRGRTDPQTGGWPGPAAQGISGPCRSSDDVTALRRHPCATVCSDPQGRAVRSSEPFLSRLILVS